MRRLLDPVSTCAVILGAHDWTQIGLPQALSFLRSAEGCYRYMLLQPPDGLGLQPDVVLNLFDDSSSASTQLIRISDTIGGFVRDTRDTGQPLRDVLIYYIGHGTCESGSHLHLLVRDSRKGIEEQSSIGTDDLARVLRVAAPQQRRLVVLDCCFSEAAAADFDAMGTLEEAVAAAAGKDLEQSPSPERGTLLLCSSPRNRVSIGSATGERTLFTGALLEVLGEGSVSHNSAMLSFADLREAVWDRMLNEQGAGAPRPALHQPDQSEGDLTHVPAFPNAAIFRQEPREPGARKTKQEFAEAGLRAEADAGSKPPNTRDKSVATLQRLQATRVSHRFASIPRSAWLRTTALALILPILFYVYREVTRDVLIMNPFTVPKHFEEAGLTSEVMANRIGDRLRQIEIQTQTHMKKDNLTSLVEEGSVPHANPGDKIGLDDNC